MSVLRRKNDLTHNREPLNNGNDLPFVEDTFLGDSWVAVVFDLPRVLGRARVTVADAA